jgi:hypothetical protein
MSVGVVDGAHEGRELEAILTARVHDAHPVPEDLATARRPGATSDGAIAADDAKVPLGCVVVPGHGRVVEEARDPVPA